MHRKKIGDMKLILSLVIGALAVHGAMAAPNIQFEASVDRTRVGQTDPIRFTLSIVSNENIGHLPAPEISLKDFYVEGPSVSTRVDMINFNTSFTRELVYVLYAKRTGKIKIGPARLELGGENYQTKAIEIEVVKSSNRRSSKGNARTDKVDEPSLEDALFVSAQVDYKRAYVGQQITVEYDLFYRFRLHNVGFKEIPTFAGFWVKDLFVAQQLNSHREVVEGVTFNVAPLRRVALYPTSAGTYDIGVLAISCDIPKQRGRRGSLVDEFFSGDPFFSRSQSVIVRSEELEVEVLPLPEKDRPQEFTGAVGRFQLRAEAQPTHVPAGDPVTLQVIVEGQGNLAAVQAPKIQVGAGVKLYDPTLEEEEKIVDGLYGGRRLFEYILIPEEGGMMEITPVRFVYFDPYESRYQTLESEPIIIRSEGTVGEVVVEGYGLSRKDIEAVGQDIRYIKPDVEELGMGVLVHRSFLFWMLQGTMPVVFFALLILQRHQRRLKGDIAYARQRRAKGEAAKRLAHADELLAAGEVVAFHAEVQSAVLEFLSDRLNLAAAGLTRETSAEILEGRGVDAETVESLRDLLTRCDFARFAPTESSPADMAEARRLAGELVEGLESWI